MRVPAAMARRRTHQLAGDALGVAGLVVGREEADRQEERPVIPRVAPYEPDRLVPEHVGLVVAWGLSPDVSVRVPLVILEDVVAPHAIRGVVDQPIPLRPATRFIWRAVLAVAVEEFSYVR